jgi:sugar-specific transcriptional regulator TrmB
MQKELKEIGLSNYESKILEALSREKLNLRELSKKSQVPFGKVYSIIKSLKEKNIIQETNSRPKLVYIENFSEIILRLIRDKQEKERKINERLRELATEIDKNKGKETRFFQIVTTIEDNKKIQLRSFQEAESEVLQILNIYHKPKSNRESKTMWEKEIIKAVERGIIFKSIYPKNTRLPILLEKLNKKHPKKFQVKRFDTDFTRCDIIDGNKVMIKLVHQDALQFGGILFIENEKLADNFRKIFDEIWQNVE